MVQKQSDGLVLITGAAGFIGFHLSCRLLDEGFKVYGLDDLNSYYDVHLKRSRLRILQEHSAFTFKECDIAIAQEIAGAFEECRPEIVINLAAQAGVRYSLVNPEAYGHSNLRGFLNVLEMCRQHQVSHLLYASSSSVYGGNSKVPFEESDAVEHPISLYAATKRSNELMADCYSHLYGIPATGLRFFTVYGPYGRPDMAYYSFTKDYFDGEPIRVYRNEEGQSIMRDFTYVDDVVESVVRLLHKRPTESPPHRLLNIGGSQPTELAEFIRLLEVALGRAVGVDIAFDKIFERQKPGDVPVTYASTERLRALTGYEPTTHLALGLQRFADWFVAYHQ